MKLSLKISAILLICFFSCKKPQDSSKSPHCNHLPTKFITSEISNFKFKKGSYWIYLDSISLTIDTMRVDSIIFSGVSPYQYCPNNDYELYQFQVNKNYDIYDCGGDIYTLDGDKFMINQQTESGFGSIVYSSSSSKIDSVYIYDRCYKSVVVSNRGNIKLYYNSSFGLLKREVYDYTNQLISNQLLKDKFIIR